MFRRVRKIPQIDPASAPDVDEKESGGSVLDRPEAAGRINIVPAPAAEGGGVPPRPTRVGLRGGGIIAATVHWTKRPFV